LTSQAFILSQKPHLLLVAVDQYVDKENEKVHFTRIHYANKSTNPFYDLTIKIKVSTPNTTVDLSNLFAKNMYMAAHDARDRNFETKYELRKRGFDIDAAATSGQDIMLSLGYNYSFGRTLERIEVQDYIWESTKQKWSIRFPLLG
jgi:hypothetical protein